MMCQSCGIVAIYFIPPVNVSFQSEVTDRRSDLAICWRRTLCTGAAAIMTLFTDIYHLCYHIQSDISRCANCEMRKRKICLSEKWETKCEFCATFFLGLDLGRSFSRNQISHFIPLKYEIL